MNSSVSFIEVLKEGIETTDGKFKVQKSGSVPADMIILSAIVELPPNETGIVDLIRIVHTDNEVEYECKNIEVINGTDLIIECGDPAILRPGETIYMAHGSNFNPDLNVKFCIHLNTTEEE